VRQIARSAARFASYAPIPRTLTRHTRRSSFWVKKTRAAMQELKNPICATVPAESLMTDRRRALSQDCSRRNQGAVAWYTFAAASLNASHCRSTQRIRLKTGKQALLRGTMIGSPRNPTRPLWNGSLRACRFPQHRNARPYFQLLQRKTAMVNFPSMVALRSHWGGLLKNRNGCLSQPRDGLSFFASGYRAIATNLNATTMDQTDIRGLVTAVQVSVLEASSVLQRSSPKGP